MVYFNNLTDSEKIAVRKTLNARRAVERANKKLDKALAEVFDIVKTNGEVVKGCESIKYNPALAPSLKVKSNDLKIAYPAIFEELAKLDNGKREYLSCKVKKPQE